MWKASVLLSQNVADLPDLNDDNWAALVSRFHHVDGQCGDQAASQGGNHEEELGQNDIHPYPETTSHNPTVDNK